MKNFSVMIVGGGVIGLTCAALLSQNNFDVAIVTAHDTPTHTSSHPARVFAIHATAQKLFQYLSLWDALSENASALEKMLVWDHTQQTQLHINSHDLGCKTMGWVIAQDDIIKILYAKLLTDPRVTFFPHHVSTAIMTDQQQIILKCTSDQTLSAALLIGADGAHSWVRTQMPITLQTRSYHQKSIIAVITSEKPHQQCAYQKFLTTGPVALLPLSHPHHEALVWSADDFASDALLALSDESFSHRLTMACDFKLGKLKILSTRQQFPLMMRHVTEYASDHIALVGDAAHTIHPLAGLGVNLGLMDAACLMQVLIDARAQKKSLGDLQTLRRYTRWRKSENEPIIGAMRGLKEVFSIDSTVFNFIRSLSVNAIDRCVPIKKQFMKIAMGQSRDLPEFLSNHWL